MGGECGKKQGPLTRLGESYNGAAYLYHSVAASLKAKRQLTL